MPPVFKYNNSCLQVQVHICISMSTITSKIKLQVQLFWHVYIHHMYKVFLIHVIPHFNTFYLLWLHVIILILNNTAYFLYLFLCVKYIINYFNTYWWFFNSYLCFVIRTLVFSFIFTHSLYLTSLIHYYIFLLHIYI